MKKIILCAFVALAFTTGYAQITTDAGTFTKPVAKTTIIEASLTPDLTGGGIFSLPSLNSDLGLLGVKVRRFDSDKKAWRFGANLALSDSGKDQEDAEIALGVSVGIERHMKGAERLSTYWGYEFNAGYVCKNNSWEDYDDYDAAIEYPNYDLGQTKKFGAGASLFTGFDYYVMPKIYLGAEVAYGVAVTNTKPEHGDSTTAIELSPSITPSFRLGWQF